MGIGGCRTTLMGRWMADEYWCCAAAAGGHSAAMAGESPATETSAESQGGPEWGTGWSGARPGFHPTPLESHRRADSARGGGNRPLIERREGMRNVAR